MSKYICKYCGKEFDNSKQLGGHISCCSKNPNFIDRINKIKQTIQNKKHLYTFKCEICGKEYQLELTEKMYNKGKYKKTCSDKCAKQLTVKNTNTDNKLHKLKETLHYKNNIKHIEVSNTNNHTCEVCGKEYFYKKYNPYSTFNSEKYCSEECKKIGLHNKLSENAKKHGFGGYQPNSIKKHHHGKYCGIRCDSSWELAFLVYYKEHDLYIDRCAEYRTYIGTDNKQHKYFPDFITDDGIIEIKAVNTEIVEIKHKYNPDIKILYKKDIQHCLNYVISKYGNEFWNILYDK